MNRSFSHHVDFDAEEILQILDKRNAVKQAATGLKVNQNVEIAGGRCLAARHRAEKADIPGAVLACQM